MTPPDEDIHDIITSCHNNIAQLLTDNEEIDNIINQLQTKQIENKNKITELENTITQQRHRINLNQHRLQKEKASKFL